MVETLFWFVLCVFLFFLDLGFWVGTCNIVSFVVVECLQLLSRGPTSGCTGCVLSWWSVTSRTQRPRCVSFRHSQKELSSFVIKIPREGNGMDNPCTIPFLLGKITVYRRNVLLKGLRFSCFLSQLISIQFRIWKIVAITRHIKICIWFSNIELVRDYMHLFNEIKYYTIQNQKTYRSLSHSLLKTSEIFWCKLPQFRQTRRKLRDSHRVGFFPSWKCNGLVGRHDHTMRCGTMLWPKLLNENSDQTLNVWCINNIIKKHIY